MVYLYPTRKMKKLFARVTHVKDKNLFFNSLLSPDIDIKLSEIITRSYTQFDTRAAITATTIENWEDIPQMENPQ